MPNKRGVRLIKFWGIILPSLIHFFVFDALNLWFSDPPGVIWHPPVYLALESTLVEKMLLLKNGWRYELQLSQVWIKSNGACFRVIFEILKFTGVGHVTISRKICQNQSRWIILKLSSLERAQKTKHFPYKNHGLEMNGSIDIVVLAFLSTTSSKFKMATELPLVGIFL